MSNEVIMVLVSEFRSHHASRQAPQSRGTGRRRRRGRTGGERGNPHPARAGRPGRDAREVTQARGQQELSRAALRVVAGSGRPRHFFVMGDEVVRGWPARTMRHAERYRRQGSRPSHDHRGGRMPSIAASGSRALARADPAAAFRGPGACVLARRWRTPRAPTREVRCTAVAPPPGSARPAKRTAAVA